ncbi:hypothetical protein ACIO3O_36850 [Streptomyces sp. NPDC087440]|uniref:hypothetical protein n=1 Tax=Streptomyces sp. NPDC087440 TaxID=3365790 RepID=UPI00382B62F7
MPQPAEGQVTLTAIARMAGVGRAAVVHWRRRHGGLNATGGTDQFPLFPREAAEQWLRGIDKLPPLPATVTFSTGYTLTVYGPQLFSPALPMSGGARYEEFQGYIEYAEYEGPWPTAKSVRIERPGKTPYEVRNADVDVSYAGGPMRFLRLIWPVEEN